MSFQHMMEKSYQPLKYWSPLPKYLDRQDEDDAYNHFLNAMESMDPAFNDPKLRHFKMGQLQGPFLSSHFRKR